LHWAIKGKTASELIAQRVDASKPNMGLTTWKNAPTGKVLKGDIGIKLVEKEYTKFRVIQDQNFVSDFENEVKKITKPNKSDQKKM
jgi:hypothetical protein